MSFTWHTLIDPSTGEIVRAFVGDEETAELNRPPHLVRVPGRFSAEEGYFVGLDYVGYSDLQREQKRNRPAGRAAWDNLSMAWLDQRTLDEAREAKWKEIKAARDAVEFGGFAHDGKAFDSDQISQGRITGAVQLAGLAQAAGQPFFITWTLADNTAVGLDALGMLNVGNALAQHVTAAHSRARLLRNQINQAMTPEQLASIHW